MEKFFCVFWNLFKARLTCFLDYFDMSKGTVASVHFCANDVKKGSDGGSAGT